MLAVSVLRPKLAVSHIQCSDSILFLTLNSAFFPPLPPDIRLHPLDDSSEFFFRLIYEWYETQLRVKDR